MPAELSPRRARILDQASSVPSERLPLEYHNAELGEAVRRDLGFGSVEEMVDVFLEARKASQRALDFFVWVDMPLG